MSSAKTTTKTRKNSKNPKNGVNLPSYDFFVALHFNFMPKQKHSDGTQQNGSNSVEKEANGIKITDLSWVVINAKTGNMGEEQRVIIEQDKSSAPIQNNPCVQYGKSLKEAIQKFDTFVKKRFTSSNTSFCIIIDGSFSLEECLEGLKTVPRHFYEYFNLKKEYMKRQKLKNISIEELMDTLSVSNDKKNDSSCLKTSKMVSKLISEGHKFCSPEKLNSPNIKRDAVVKLRGLPWQATESDIIEFFPNLKIADKGIHIVLNYQGRATGEAYIEFESEVDKAQAMKRDKCFMGHRYIEVFSSTKHEMEKSKYNMQRELGIFGNTIVVRMRGLPFNATEEDIAKFFDGLDIGGVYLGIGPDGRKTGDAYVEFPNAEQANEALKRNKEKIANRYIELFRSSHQELLAVKSMMNCYMYPIPMYPMYPPIPPQQMMEFVPPTNSEEHQFSEHVVRIRGLPYSCDEVDVADFFKDLNIAPHGIHLIFNQYNKPTGEAYVEFDTAEDVEEALKLHKQMMGDRYIEVFKSSKSEMVSACMDPTIMDTMMYIPEGMPMVGMMDPYYGYPPYPYNGYYPPYMDYYGNGYYNNGYYPKKYYAKKDGKTLKLRGLPFDSTVEDIIEFFKGYKIDENTITFAMNMDGRPTGEAWVTFADKEESQRALKERNRCHIGKRYIELFLIS